MNRNDALRVGSRLGKYRIEKRLGEGAFAVVYQAMDTLEGLRVALKIPHSSVLDAETEEDFRKEIRLAARLQHPRILPLKSADQIDGRLVLAYPLGEKTLADRLRSRISIATALEYSEQMLEAIAFAHEQRVIHCDIKPENLLLCDGEIMLADFGIAKVTWRTLTASGAGTIGYCAPEQAMGKPSFRSDVFSAGLIMYRMVGGYLPEWPFDWPPPGIQRVRSYCHSDYVKLLQKSMDLNPRKRYASGTSLLTAFNRIKQRIVKKNASRRVATKDLKSKTHWKSVQWKQFQRQFGKLLETKCHCSQCSGSVSELMTHCPWCGDDRERHDEETSFPLCCPRCHRGLKSDWHYCPWCFGPGFEVSGTRRYSDKRYIARCTNGKCKDRRLMAFMRYCPWCHRKVGRKWKIEGSTEKCNSCGWGVVSEYWSFCPWCGKKIGK